MDSPRRVEYYRCDSSLKLSPLSTRYADNGKDSEKEKTASNKKSQVNLAQSRSGLQIISHQSTSFDSGIAENLQDAPNKGQTNSNTQNSDTGARPKTAKAKVIVVQSISRLGCNNLQSTSFDSGVVADVDKLPVKKIGQNPRNALDADPVRAEAIHKQPIRNPVFNTDDHAKKIRALLVHSASGRRDPLARDMFYPRSCSESSSMSIAIYSSSPVLDDYESDDPDDIYSQYYYREPYVETPDGLIIDTTLGRGLLHARAALFNYDADDELTYRASPTAMKKKTLLIHVAPKEPDIVDGIPDGYPLFGDWQPLSSFSYYEQYRQQGLTEYLEARGDIAEEEGDLRLDLTWADRENRKYRGAIPPTFTARKEKPCRRLVSNIRRRGEEIKRQRQQRAPTPAEEGEVKKKGRLRRFLGRLRKLILPCCCKKNEGDDDGHNYA